MRGSLAALAGFLTFSFATIALAQTADNTPVAKAEALVASMGQANTFSGTVLVAKDGKPVFRKAVGMANREWNVPNVPEGKFRLGSITKGFTAAAILQLQEAGKLSVDDPVSKYYPDAPAAWKAITVKHLLTHRSGIPSYTGLPNFFNTTARQDMTPDEIIKLTRDKPLEFEPGSKYAYDNTGYIILGYIVEKVSGQPYADYIQEHIFKPLGMNASGYDVSATILPQRAAGYDRGKTGPINAPFLSMTLPYAAGSLYSTVDDLLLWDQALYGDKILNAASRKAMFSDYGSGYGFGWSVEPQFGHASIMHGGGINGFVTAISRFPDDKLTIIALSNYTGSDLGKLTDGLAAIFLDIPPRTAVRGGDKIVRRLIGELQRGAPDYAKMGDALAGVTKAQLPVLQKMTVDLGALKAVTLLSAEPNGYDRYRVTFEKGVVEYGVKIEKNAVVSGAYIRPAT